jgi:hypothetical protein
MANENQNGQLEVSRVLLATWVSEIWRDIPVSAVTNTWRAIGFY